MKRVSIFILAIALTLCLCMPAMAISGVDEPTPPKAPAALPEGTFDATLSLVGNTPTVEENEDFDEINVWTAIDEKTEYKVGDEVTFILSYDIPAAPEGFSEEELANIMFDVTSKGLKDVEIFEENGLEVKIECDYTTGTCRILEGYGNVEVSGDTYRIAGYPDREVTVVFKAKVAEKDASVELKTTVGQYDLPTSFTAGKLSFKNNYATIENNSYAAYSMEYENKEAVYKDAIAFLIGEKGAECEHIIVTHITDSYAVVAPELYEDAEGFGFAPYADGAISFEGIITSGDTFNTLNAIFEKYMTFFGFTLENGGVLDDGVFVNAFDSYQNNDIITLNVVGEGGQTEPTPTPNPDPPKAGAVSLLLIGTVAAGAGIIGVGAIRRKK